MESKTTSAKYPFLAKLPWKGVATLAMVLAVAGLAFALQSQWLPPVKRVIAELSGNAPTERAGGQGHSDGHDHDHGDHEDGHDHDHGKNGHDHGHGKSHEGHEESNSLELSKQAMASVGLKTGKVSLGSFTRYTTMPAMVTTRPGLSTVSVTAPLGGRVTKLYAIEGEAVETGRPLFELRLTHEELVQAQSNFLRTAEELDVVAREIKRLKSVQLPGAIPGKTIREREYEQMRLMAVFNAQRQSLLLHGLTDEQVDAILEERKLLQSITVMAPAHANVQGSSPDHPFTLRKLRVRLGQYLDAGEELCELVDYSQLYVQGRAFEHDADELVTAARDKRTVIATREDNEGVEKIDGLMIDYVENEVEPESRALYFYVALPNKIVFRKEFAPGRFFVTWRFKPGQQMEVRVPVEVWKDQIVLPVEAVAKDGIEYYVFEVNGSHFDRKPVTVVYRDRFQVVVKNDGSIPLGATIAMKGAQQLQMALKNKAGGGADPHAGHNH